MPCGRAPPACADGRTSPRKVLLPEPARGTLYDGGDAPLPLVGEPLAMYSMGGLAEYAVFLSAGPSPSTWRLEFEPAGILGCAALTAYGAVRRGARPFASANGQLWSLRRGRLPWQIFVAQFARASGALHVIAVDIRREKLAAARGPGRDGHGRRICAEITVAPFSS